MVSSEFPRHATFRFQGKHRRIVDYPKMKVAMYSCMTLLACVGDNNRIKDQGGDGMISHHI